VIDSGEAEPWEVTYGAEGVDLAQLLELFGSVWWAAGRSATGCAWLSSST
jgi:hypothetical protein